MSNAGDNLDELRAALRANAAGVGEANFGSPNRSLSTRNTLRWGRKGSLSLEVRGARRGLWHSHEDGQGGDLLDLIRYSRGGSFPDALAWARNWTGIGEPPENAADDEQERQRQTQRDADREARHAAQEAAAAADRAARIGGARRYAVAPASVPITDPRGGLGAWYVNRTRGIPMPAGGHPDCVRFHPGKNALLVVATTEDGAAQAVQFIHLDEYGEKLDREEVEARGLPNVKWTYGPLDDAAVRLPGDPAGPLLLGEGFETAYAAFAATGYETQIALGSVGRLDLPTGRKIVVLRDDDAKGSPGDNTLRAVLAGWHRDGFDVSVATPWATRRGDTSDFNDLIRADGPEAVAARIEAALAAPSVPPLATPTHGLPAYHPAPVEPREQVLARQAEHDPWGDRSRRPGSRRAPRDCPATGGGGRG